MFCYFCSGSALFTKIWVSHFSVNTLQRVGGGGGDQSEYCNDPKFSDRQAWANTVDPDQTAPNYSDQGLHCSSFFLTHCSMVKPNCSNFRLIKATSGCPTSKDLLYNISEDNVLKCHEQTSIISLNKFNLSLPAALTAFSCMSSLSITEISQDSKY